MRSNSGKDESRNNVRDPTLRDDEKKRTSRTTGAGQKTTDMGSRSRKTGQRGSTGRQGDR